MALTPTLTRLRWAITLNGWRKSVLTLVFSVLGTIYLLGLAVLLVAALVTGMPGLDPQTRGVVTVLAASAVVLGWLVLPPLVTGVDATLDPTSFLLFPIRPRTLTTGLLLSTFTTPVGALTLLGLLGVAASWWDAPAALVPAALGAVLAAVTAVCLGYGVTGLMASFTGRRRVREAMSLALLVPLMLGGTLLGRALQRIEDLFWLGPVLARVAVWTPFGAGLGAGWAAAEGRWGLAALHLAVALAWAAAAAALWVLAIRRAVEPTAAGRPTSAAHRGDRAARLTWLGRPATSARTAIAARALVYWRKDPRYAASLVVLPLLAVLLWMVGSAAPDEGSMRILLGLGPLVGWALGFAISADIGYDHTAFHLHVVSGVRGIDDRLGRLLGLAVWGLPATVAAVLLSAAVVGRWDLLPALLGVSLGLFGACSGLSLLVSARWVYPVPKPGDSPFTTPQGAAMRTALVQGAQMLATVVLAVPLAVPLVALLVTGDPLWGWATLAVGVVWGALALWLGARAGAAWFDRTQAETLQAVRSW